MKKRRTEDVRKNKYKSKHRQRKGTRSEIEKGMERKRQKLWENLGKSVK